MTNVNIVDKNTFVINKYLSILGNADFTQPYIQIPTRVTKDDSSCVRLTEFLKTNDISHNNQFSFSESVGTIYRYNVGIKKIANNF